ncbi:MAG TPA: PEP-CTERM sorting domain-containing protein [Vicinamibacterales bacterium]
MRSLLCTLAAASLLAAATTGHAAQATLDFEALEGGHDGVHVERPANFYNGGLGSMGAGPGQNYGITFTGVDATSVEPFAICKVNFCNSPGNALFIFGDEQNGTQHGAVLHVEGGFSGIFEFDAAIAAGDTVDVIVRTSLPNPPYASKYQVATIRNPNQQDTCGRLECAFYHYTVDLTDHIHVQQDYLVYDIQFGTRLTDAVFIDNITFHDLNLPTAESPTTAVPEPATILLAATALGLVLARQRRRNTPPSVL